MAFNSFLSHRYLDKVRKEKAAIECGEHLFRTVTLRPFPTTDDQDSAPPTEGPKSFCGKLRDLCHNENWNPEFPEFKANLLQRLVRNGQLNVVILNLYPGDTGFTIEISGRETPSPPMFLPYEDPLLECIDRGELHPSFVDLLKSVDVFYNGCVLTEIRDYRRSNLADIDTDSPSYNSHYVVLKPTTQTIVADLAALAPENSDWSYDDRLALESMLLCATSGPLCLDPNPAVAILANRVQYYKNSLHRPSIKKMVQAQSQVTLNKKKRLEELPTPPYLQHFDFLSQMKRNFAHSIPTKMYFPSEVKYPGSEDLEFLSERPNISELSSNASDLSQEYQEKCIKIKRNPGGIQCAKISVKLSEDGSFEVTPNLRCNGQDDFKESPSFKFPSKELVVKYIDQFTETFTEKGTLTIENNAESEQMINPSVLQASTNAAPILGVEPSVNPAGENASSDAGIPYSTESQQCPSIGMPMEISDESTSLQQFIHNQNRSSSSSDNSEFEF